MLGSRAIWHDGWKTVTTRPTISGWSHFNDDTWELYHTDTDRSELCDLAAERPGEAVRDGEPLVRRGGRQRRPPARRSLPGFTGGTIKRVAIDLGGQPYLDLEREAEAMLARE